MFVVSGPLHKGTEQGKHGDYGHIDPYLLDMFRIVQNYTIAYADDLRLTVTSGYRCPRGNFDVCRAQNDGEGDDRCPRGSVYDVEDQTSRHVIGKAADVRSVTKGDERWTVQLKDNIREYVFELFAVTPSTPGTERPEIIKYPSGHLHIAWPRGFYSPSVR